MKKVTRIIGLLGGVILAAVAVMFFVITNGLSAGAKVPLQGIDLSDVPDGSYTGAYEFKRWSNTVVVHVKDHKITAIDLEKDVEGAEITDCAEEMVRRVIEAQDTKVDAVSGATVTSKAYLKAIEGAFSQIIPSN
ncbi:MAG: FMN-binding protein [Candidatus Pelethousia sp.]|nr:FMN-binding protein [Candidatus Pelethousia sp.]